MEPLLNKPIKDIFDETYCDSSIDYTEYLGEINLETIIVRRISTKIIKPLEPDSNFKTGWDLTGLFLIIYEAILIPYRVAFNAPASGSLMIFEFLIDMFFIIDICNT